MRHITRSQKYAMWLLLLLVLFCCRVAGQMLVAFMSATFLPPMQEWYSGLLPYRYLLPAQFLIIFLFGKICLDLFRETGYFSTPRQRMGRPLSIFGILYLESMIIRYILRMWLYPQERWTGGSIPIFFHWVLAAYVLVLASFNASESRNLENNVREVPTRSGQTRSVDSKLGGATAEGGCATSLRSHSHVRRLSA